MPLKISAIKPDADVAFPSKAAGNGADFLNFPTEQASNVIVVENFSNLLRRKIIPEFNRHALAPVRDGDGNRQRQTDKERDEQTPEDAARELAVIETRIKFLNWIEFALGKKRAAKDGQVEPTGRRVVS